MTDFVALDEPGYNLDWVGGEDNHVGASFRCDGDVDVGPWCDNTCNTDDGSVAISKPFEPCRCRNLRRSCTMRAV